MPAKLQARLAKRFGAFSLDLALEANPGITALWGSSGAGKSLTLDCIAGFVKPDAGRILLGDELLFDASAKVSRPPRRRRCAYIFQDHALFPHMSIRENLGFAASVAPVRLSSLVRRRRINELLEAFQLTDHQHKFAHQLSGGQKQRAALARTLIGEPQLLLLDEPTRGLDAALRHSFYAVLSDIQLRSEAPVLLVTHDLEECFRVAQSVCLLADGHILQSGPAHSVLQKPASLQAAQALGIFNLLPAIIRALDPGRNTSCLHLPDFNAEIAGPYLPGHLLGDRGHLCVPQSATHLGPVNESRTPQLIMPVLSSFPASEGTRILLAFNLSAAVSPQLWQHWSQPDHVAVRFDPAAVHFLA